jgi:Mrp family chromosome partitioning ATPase
VAGVVVVTSPQDLVSLIVEKAVRMADMMKVPVLGLVENMSSFKCPDCGGVHRIFGEGRAREIAEAHSIGAFASLPIDPALAAAVDAGEIEGADTSALKSVLDAVL